MKEASMKNTLNSADALRFVERIETVRANAADNEAVILAELRASPGYEQNQDKDLLTAIELRAEARQQLDDAETLIGSFDWTFDEEAGENVRKPSS